MPYFDHRHNSRIGAGTLARRLILCALLAGFPVITRGDGYGQSASGPTTDSSAGGFTVEKLLPASVAQTLDVNVWGWFSDLRDSERNAHTYWEADVALGATQRLGDRLAVTGEMHFIDDFNTVFGWLEQAYATADLLPQQQTLLTVGKFNANFGIEPRDEWDRLTGTTGLLFGAQPQDLLGLMLTQPLGNSDFTIKPFVTSNFEGKSDFDGPPAAGAVLTYRPSQALTVSLTNWLGPGFTRPQNAAAPGSLYYPTINNSGGDTNNGYPTTANNTGYTAAYLADDWLGPRLVADRGGLLYFVDANVTWMPRPDLTLAAEGLIATTGSSAGDLGWAGAMVLGNYDITDRLRVFARWSFLDDAQGLVTGFAGRRHELSGGVGYTIIQGTEIRGEYRHDFANSGDVDTLSVHLTLSY